MEQLAILLRESRAVVRQVRLGNFGKGMAESVPEIKPGICTAGNEDFEMNLMKARKRQRDGVLPKSVLVYRDAFMTLGWWNNILVISTIFRDVEVQNYFDISHENLE